MDILQGVTEIFREVLAQPELVLTRQMTAAEVRDWDSIGHIQLVEAMEESFNIVFSAREMRSWKNVGELCDSIAAKTGHS
jgi:acyl carrier protein